MHLDLFIYKPAIVSGSCVLMKITINQGVTWYKDDG